MSDVDFQRDLKEWKALREFFPNTVEGFVKLGNLLVYKKHKKKLTVIQEDIARVLANPDEMFKMIQAQRGQAKTTITAYLVVWFLIHNPRLRTKVVSAITKASKKIFKEIVDVFEHNDFMRCMRPNKRLGDRASYENGYDINRLFRGDGAERDASIECTALDSAKPSNRADLIIVDDIESDQNAKTEAAREIIFEAFGEYRDWVGAHGRIIVLGTPQSRDSVYNELPKRGYRVYIWPGRYPSVEEEERYGGFLAPIITNALAKSDKGIPDQFGRLDLRSGGGVGGVRGKTVDPEFEFVNEDVLIGKEAANPTRFQLQQMLDTSMLDEGMFPLKIKNLMFIGLNDSIPSDIRYTPLPEFELKPPEGFSVGKPKLYRPSYYNAVNEWIKFEEVVMAIDPSGGGTVSKDETSFAIGTFHNTKLYVLKIGGVKGGYEEEQLNELVDLIKEFNVTTVTVENNYGNGALASALQKVLTNDPKAHGVGILKPNVSGQKEVRIIERVAPWIGTHDLIFAANCLEDDVYYCNKHGGQESRTYSLFYQMDKLSAERGCLKHDDRVDALSILCDHFSKRRNVNVIDELQRQKLETHNEFINGYLNRRVSREESFVDYEDTIGWDRM